MSFFNAARVSTQATDWPRQRGWMPSNPTPKEFRFRNGPRLAGVIQEPRWRERVALAANDDPSRIFVCRWKDDGSSACACDGVIEPDHVTVAINLQSTDLLLSVDGRPIHDGKMPAGATYVTAAGQRAFAEFRSPCDIIHLYVPVGRLGAISREIGKSPDVLDQTGLSASDPAVEGLAWLLLKAGEFESFAADLYVDGIAVAIVTRLLHCRSNGRGGPGQRHGLVKWRLKRVQDLIEADVSRPLSLADLAACAGLSRMHFAAEFRAATGMRPHEYVVRKRIQRAQEILRSSAMPLVEVALSVGFQTQAHFTTIFRRILGETPGRWRQQQCLESQLSSESQFAAPRAFASDCLATDQG